LKPAAKNTRGTSVWINPRENSAVAEHIIDFCPTSVLDRTSAYMDHLAKEGTEIHLNTE
jgi:hypothetical protein